MYNQINKCEQIKEVKQIKNNEYNLNMEILSSIKSIPCKTISLDNNEIINSKDTNKINLGNLSESEPNNTQFTCSTSISRDSVINKNSPYQNYLTPNSIFKPMINQFKVFNYINYFPNFSPTFQFLVNPYNSFSQNYYNFENNYYNFPSLIYNYNQVILNNNNNNISSENNNPSVKELMSDKNVKRAIVHNSNQTVFIGHDDEGKAYYGEVKHDNKESAKEFANSFLSGKKRYELKES